MAFGTPEDDDQPQYDALATLLAGYQPAQAAQVSPTNPPPPQADPAAPPPQTQQAVAPQTAAPQMAATQQAQPQQAPNPQPTIALPPAPPAPQIDQEKYQQLEGQVKQFAKPTDRSDPTVKPKWYDRLAGGLVGFGAGFHGDVAGGIRAGSDITNRRYDAAEATREGKEKAAQQNLGDYEHQIDLAQKGYTANLEGKRVNQEGARINKEASDSDRNFGFQKDKDTRDFANTVLNQTRAQSNTEDARDQALQFHTDDEADKKRTADETARHNKAEEANYGRSIDSYGKGGKSGADKTTMSLSQFQGLLNTKDREYAQAQQNKTKELQNAFDDGDKAAINQKYDGVAQDLQSRWNTRLAQADPEGKYAPKGGQQQAPPPQQQAQPRQAAPPPPQAPPAQQQQVPPQQGAPSPPSQQSKGFVSVAKARAKPEYRGKSDEEIRAAIKSFGYTPKD